MPQSGIFEVEFLMHVELTSGVPFHLLSAIFVSLWWWIMSLNECNLLPPLSMTLRLPSSSSRRTFS